MAKQGQTGIVWTDETWNPVTGCTKVSQGCKHCYAERDWHRLQHLPRFAGRAFTDVVCHPERLDQPLRWAKPRRIFVNSMSDLFHEDVPDEFIDQVFAVMALAKQHKFQVLTKRPQRMLDYCKTLGRHHEIDRVSIAAKRISNKTGFSWRMCDEGWCLPNVWLGVSVEDQATADQRIPILLQTPAAVRWISAEPLLGPIDLNRLQFLGGEVGDKMSALSGRYLAAYDTLPPTTLRVPQGPSAPHGAAVSYCRIPPGVLGQERNHSRVHQCNHRAACRCTGDTQDRCGCYGRDNNEN